MAEKQEKNGDDGDVAYREMVTAVERYFAARTEGALPTSWVFFGVGQQPEDFGTGTYSHAYATPEGQLYPTTLGLVALLTETLDE